MGVNVDKTWTWLATQNGFVIYNMGVQGYAPQQITGILQKYGKLLEPRYVIFGYTPGFEHRALFFRNYEYHQGVFPQGGIEAINNYTKEIRIKEVRAFKVLNALVDYYEVYFYRNVSATIRQFASNNEWDFYKTELEQSTVVFNTKSEGWNLTRQSILDAYDISRQLNAEFTILTFYHRPTIYAEKLFDEKLPFSSYELSAAAEVKKLASENNIAIIDIYQPLKDYVDGLPTPIVISHLPYFAKDGHLNEIGQEIVAKTVVDFFKKQILGRMF